MFESRFLAVAFAHLRPLAVALFFHFALKMAAEGPLYSTIPHGFHYHYTDGGPKTPEHEKPDPTPASPQGFRIRRRLRPRLNTMIPLQSSEIMAALQDTPIPTIEVPDYDELPRPALLQHNSEPAGIHLSPFLGRSLTAPRTPSAQRTVFDSDWDSSYHKCMGDSFDRPVSALSSVSDSSDDSDADSEDRLSYGGSCTSPESEADPFNFSSPSKVRPVVGRRLMDDLPPLLAPKSTKAHPVMWTADMDKHIWTIYMRYLQDPTVTPFKTLPGSAPPLGVCHRVAREAKKTWRGVKSETSSVPKKNIKGRGGTPDTIVAERSGSSTPTRSASQKPLSWPKSGSVTRKRLRDLCKRKATIAPHYQRLLQSRSPSPFSSSGPRYGSGNLWSPRAGSPGHQSSFATRDVQLSLTTSTSSTMQPDGPLAQLARPQAAFSSDEWFNDPAVPWASPAPIPSDIEPAPTAQEANDDSLGLEQPPRLGSPFGNHHTWGPSHSRQQVRPSTTHMTYDTASVPRLRSPVQLHGTFPSNQKRRAQHQLEDVFNPEGLNSRKADVEEVSSGSSLSARRRVRLRGFSLGDGLSRLQGQNLFPEQESHEALATPEGSDNADMELDNKSSSPTSSPTESIKRLGSPFAGISGRPTRVRGRHLTSLSLSFCDLNEFTSIDQRLDLTRDDPFR